MAKKASTVFVCQECGNESPRWMGQCICGAWNSMVEEKIVSETSKDTRQRHQGKHAPKALQLTSVDSGEKTRMDTGIGELNRVLGGGLVEGSLSLISGEPGIGKSTLIIQTASKIASKGRPVLYVTGEESEEQIKIRADRVCPEQADSLYILAETNMENILASADSIKPVFMIVDSIQTMYTDSLESAPGTVSQVRACTNELMRLGKVENIPIFIVAHVTKSGDLAGPKIIEHLVDCVMSFTGERSGEIRILRALKNRFGTTSEIGAFRMAEEGLVEIENIAGSFLEGVEEGAEGTIATAVYEGTRPMLLEIQALTSPANVGFPRRSAIGIEASRLQMILAVLDRRAGLTLAMEDVYVNVVGGFKPEGTSTDLAVALAIYSSARGVAMEGRPLALGEIGLTGDLRSVQNAEKIVKEAERLSFTKLILPAKNAERIKYTSESMKIIGVKTLKDAIEVIKDS